MAENSSIRDLLRTIRSNLDELERLVVVAAPSREEDLPIFDPDRDAPPIQPSVDGSRLERDWCGLMLWAQLRALNVREGRGATDDESTLIAKKAGYRDGRAWNRWTGWHKDADGGRWVSDGAVETHMKYYFEQVGRAIPSDLLPKGQAAAPESSGT